MIESAGKAADTRVPEPRSSRAIVTGAAGGAFSGLTGVGGGAVMVGTVTNLRQGTVDIEVLRWVAPAAMIAAFAAALAANRVDDAVLRRIYGITALLLGIETVYSSARGLRDGRRVVEIELA